MNKYLRINGLTLLLIVSFLVSKNSTSQVQVVLDLKKFDITGETFYIRKVIDGRKNKNDIGYTRNEWDDKTPINLQYGMVKNIQQFVDFSLPHAKEFTPVFLKVLFLQVKEERSSISEITARAEIKLEFYEENSSGLRKIFEIEHYEDESFNDYDTKNIINTHERRIRSVLEYCLKEFSKRKYSTNNSISYTDYRYLSKPSKIDGLSITKNNPLHKWNNILTFGKIYSKYLEGWEISYIGFSENEDLIFPFIWSYNKYGVKTRTLAETNYKSIDYYTLGLGTQFFFKLTQNVYAIISAQIPVGVEVLKDQNNNKSNRFLIGISSTQGLLFVPKSDLGLTLGIGVYEKAWTSKIYKTNFGIEFKIGVKF